MFNLKHVVKFAVATLLATATVLPASAAPRHHHRLAPALSSAAIINLAPGDLPVTAGSNQADTDSGLYYNRLNDY